MSSLKLWKDGSFDTLDIDRLDVDTIDANTIDTVNAIIESATVADATITDASIAAANIASLVATDADIEDIDVRRIHMGIGIPPVLNDTLWLASAAPNIVYYRDSLGVDHNILAGIAPPTADDVINVLYPDARYRTLNVIKVKNANPGPFEYTSINAALATITTNSQMNPFIIDVGPGVFFEFTSIVMKPFVFLRGSGIITTTIVALNPAINLIVGADNSSVLNCTLTGATAGKAIYMSSTLGTGPFIVSNCYLGTCATLGHCHAASAITTLMFDNCKMGGIADSTVSFICTNVFPNMSQLVIENSQIQDLVPPVPNTFLRIHGLGTLVVLGNILANLGTFGSTTAIEIYDGGMLRASTCIFSGFYRGIYAPNIGLPAAIRAANFDLTTFMDLSIEHPGTTGYYTGNLEINKVFIHPSAPFAYRDVPKNTIIVEKQNFAFATVGGAVEFINPHINIDLVTTSTTITSPGLFRVDMTDASIDCIGIPPGTVLTYIDVNTMTLSNPATVTATNNANIIRARVDNHYIIKVGPGNFQESTIVLPSYIDIVGSSMENTILTVDSGYNLLDIISTTNSVVSNITLVGGGTGTRCIAIDSSSFTIYDCILRDADILLHSISTVSDSRLDINNLQYRSTFEHAIYVDGSGGFDTRLYNDNSRIFPDSTGLYGIYLSGSGIVDLKMQNCHIDAINNMAPPFVGIYVEDGAIASISGTIIEDCTTGILVANIGLAPDIRYDGTISNTDISLSIEHPGCTGYFTGIVEETSVHIHPLSDFLYRDHPRNTVKVEKHNFAFNSVSNALSYINPAFTINVLPSLTDVTSVGLFRVDMTGCEISGLGLSGGTTFTYIDVNTGTIDVAAVSSGATSVTITRSRSTNRYIIQVGPGTYDENTIALPSFIEIVGTTSESTILACSTPGTSLFTVENSIGSSISNITLEGGGGGVCIDVDSSQFELLHVTIQNDSTLLRTRTLNGETFIRLTSVVFQDYTDRAIHLDGTIVNLNAYRCEVTAMNISIRADTISLYGIYARGPFILDSIFQTVHIDSDTPSNLVGIYITDTAKVSLSDVIIEEALTGIYIPPIGGAPTLNLKGVFLECNQDINIVHPGCKGSISATAARSKSTIAVGAPISVNMLDPDVNGLISIGDLFFGESLTTVENFYPLLASGNMGLLDGGALTDGGGLNLDVASGKGYLSSTVLVTNYIEWVSVTIPIPSSSTQYIYIPLSGIVSITTSKPDIISNIILGRVRTSVTAIDWIEDSAIVAHHGTNYSDNFAREAIGVVYVSGSILTLNGIDQIDVSTGRYFYSNRYFGTSGGIAINMVQYNHVAGVFTSSIVNTVEYSLYDDNTNMIPITTGFFVKHAIYTTNQGVNEKYMIVIGQEEHTVLVDAQTGSLPMPPPFFIEAIVRIAYIIVQEGVGIVEIQDIRPILNGAAFSTSGTGDHSGLLNLAADDHTQYLLTNGGRVLTGNLDLGTNNIINVGLIDGVDTSSHASRHLPLGADPLATAAASTLTTLLTNQVGVNNSFARSDHIHALDMATSTLSIGASNIATSGFSSRLAYADHVHQGLSSIRVDTGTLRYGGVNLVSGTDISIVDSGTGDYTISSSIAAVVTSSNVGTSGVGVFKQKTLQDLEFKKLNAGSSKITITDDVINSKIDIDIVPSNIIHSTLSTLLTDDHTQYALLNGRGVGQTLTGGTLASADLTLLSTSNVTKGRVYIPETTVSNDTISGALVVGGGLGVAGRANIGNLRLDTNTISSTDIDGDINILPNGLGEVLLKSDPVSALGAATKQYADAKKSIFSSCFSTNTTSFIERNGTAAYTTMSIFDFPGSNNIGNITNISLIVGKSTAVATQQMRWRILDSTNALVICTGAVINNAAAARIDLGIVSNVPTGPAVFEIQWSEHLLGVPAAHSANARLYSINVYRV